MAAKKASTKKGGADPAADVRTGSEIGSSGVRRSGGEISEEFLKALAGDNALKVYREMEDNSPILGPALSYIRAFIVGAPWSIIDPENPSTEEKRAGVVVKEELDRMSFHTVKANALSFLSMGWSFQEIVYSVRPDGLIGWKKWAPRAQVTRLRWEFDPVDGNVSAFVQLDSSISKGQVTIPITKAILYRAEDRNGSPEGRSPLRSAYLPYYYWKRILEILGIGVERDLAGYPVYTAPSANLNDPVKRAAYEKIVRSIRRGELEGLLMPSEVDDTTKTALEELKLIASAGARQHDIPEVLHMLAVWQAMALLADFMLLGQGRVGTQALGTVKSDMFETAVDGWKTSLIDPMNRFAIPRLYEANGWTNLRPCRIELGKVQKVDLVAWAKFLDSMLNAGGTMGPKLQAFFHERAGWPAPERDPIEPSEQPNTGDDPEKDPKGDGKKKPKPEDDDEDDDEITDDDVEE
jgi:hypothetical protein